MRQAVGCKKCNRILYAEDADTNGLCADCAATEPEAKPKREKKEKA